MNLQEFERDLPAIWLVFAGSYFNHTNAPKAEIDEREKSLVDLLAGYLETQLPAAHLVNDKPKLAKIIELLKLWSQDLAIIYAIRQRNNKQALVEQMAQTFLQRIQQFDDCTLIPNGLISAKHNSHNENVSLAILKKQGQKIDWIQIDPGSAYHQRSQTLSGLTSHAYLEIKDINLSQFNQAWLSLLIGLKAIAPKGYYKDVSLYECLLAQLNGKTSFKTEADEAFIPFTHTSPVHTWQVIEQSLIYLVAHFGCENPTKLQGELRVGFKQFLVAETFKAYQNPANQFKAQCHYLLQEMCRELAQASLANGTTLQKAAAVELIDAIKTKLEKDLLHKFQRQSEHSKFDKPEIEALNFVAPSIPDYTSQATMVKTVALQISPVFDKPAGQDIIDYLKQFKRNFIEKLRKTNDFNEIVLLSAGIESFFIDYLANTHLLDTSTLDFHKSRAFSSDDVYLAETLKELADIYYACQARLVNDFLGNSTYQPQFLAKNITIQFLAYAVVVALNLREEKIGALVKQYNLCTAASANFTFDNTLSKLVIDDSRWLKVLFKLATFFTPSQQKATLFAYHKFDSSRFEFTIHNTAEQTDLEVKFAYQLLQKDDSAYRRFLSDYQELEEEKYNQKWYSLAYTDNYLPKLYCLLTKMAFTAKASLLKLPSVSSNAIATDWAGSKSSYKSSGKYYWKTTVDFQLNRSILSTSVNSDKHTNYVLKKIKNGSGWNSWTSTDPYQRLISSSDNHLHENVIIASQNDKPTALDRLRYLQLGFVQCQPELKLERLYIAVKQHELDFVHEQHCVLFKQALFETSVIDKFEDGSYKSLLQYTALTNPQLIHQLGLLCIEKALGMRLRLTQHQAVGEIIEIGLALLAFYPPAYKAEFIAALDKIYHMLDETLVQPPAHLGASTLVHLNAYLIICAQAKPALTAEVALKVIEALVAIEKYKVNNIKLDNNILRQIYVAGINLTVQLEQQLAQQPKILHQLMAKIVPTWDHSQQWHKAEEGLLYRRDDYAIKPLLGLIYYQNKPITGLPYDITSHAVYKDYFGETFFAVLPSSRKVSDTQLPCYLSVDRNPKVRITAIDNDLLIEEYIDDEYQRYIPAKILLSSQHPQLLYKQPQSEIGYRHWLSQEGILIKDPQRQVVYQWKLAQNLIYSTEHQGHLVPWTQLKESHFKALLQRVENPVWIEIIAKQAADNAPINIQTLHFPRLGLSFTYRDDQFFSQQLHGYVLAEQQQLATLQGLKHYLLLEKPQAGSTAKQVKMIIPHYEVRFTGEFYKTTVSMDLDALQDPAYFVYDVDQQVGLIKANSNAAKLYLALLYYTTASLTQDILSNSNGYHLAREHLETCWKTQPYDEIELSIIEQLLSEQTLRDLHYNRIAIYLKVVALLSRSLQLGFLYTDVLAEQNKKKTIELLESCYKKLPPLFAIYLENLPKVFERIRLNDEELREVYKYLFNTQHEYVEQFRAVEQINNHQPATLTSPSGKSYKQHYSQLFSRAQFDSTNFLATFKKYLEKMQFSPSSSLDFSRGIEGIYIARFRLEHFLQLYSLAQSSISKVKYRYLLHHMLIRAKILKATLPSDLVMLLGRTLLLVAENPNQFPQVPSWVNSYSCSFDLARRSLSKETICAKFPSVSRYYNEDYNDYFRRHDADSEENQRIWNHLDSYDLDGNRIPNTLPASQDYFSLNFERHVYVNNSQKRDIVRSVYLIAARNDALYQFFVRVMQRCDQLKYNSAMAFTIPTVTLPTLTDSIPATRPTSKPNPERPNLEHWAIAQPELVNLKQFFAIKPEPMQVTTFPFEQQLKGERNGYQQQFYQELKASWEFYLHESKVEYQWLSKNSVEQLEEFLQLKRAECRFQAQIVWNKLAEQFKHRSATEKGREFALKWYSGQVRHYHKADILTLILTPHKIADYHPELAEQSETVTQDLLAYLTHEINYAKTIRLLALMAQYQKTRTESEQASLLHRLISTLQESLDKASYRYPHWLLFQFEHHLMVRHNQQELILAMLEQTNKAMYQLNMGEGKSSVILPLLSYDLANHQQLLRINVLYPLFVTMRELLQQRFSGLVKKHVYTLPFYRDTDISLENLKLILQALTQCQSNHHILLVTPEHRMCLQLKVRELLLENQQQMTADGVFNWQTYRKRTRYLLEVYQDLSEAQCQQLLAEQDQCLKKQLINAGYLDAENNIIKVPPRGQGRKEFAKFKAAINEPRFREWSCLKAAYREILFNSKLAYTDSSEKLQLLKQISEIAALDLLDESDEILRHGTELNYTLGDKTLFAGGELRWQIPQFFIETIFSDDELRQVIIDGMPEGLTDIKLKTSEQGGVPFINWLSESYFDQEIKPLLYAKFIEAYLPIFRKYQLKVDEPINHTLNATLQDYILGGLSQKKEKQILSILADKEQVKDVVLIAKGWLSYGILFHVFNAKYRVKFGLNSNAAGELLKPIAIPFFGKDSPSKRSEFSHPDIMLGFTIISYLYQGLSKQQLKNGLLKLKDKYSHQVADAQLAKWVQLSHAKLGIEVPKWLSSFESLDLADEHCLDEVHRYLAHNPKVILFYLNQFVLAEEAFQYRYKISANAHSLVGYNPALGFSGTDDRKITMPHPVLSLRSTSQEGTNGKLLYVLSRERNSQYYSVDVNDTQELLQQFCNHVQQQQNCHIIIDAGALVTGFSNHQVASFLINELPAKFQGVIYFSDEGNQLTVLLRNQQILPLHDCHINKQHLFAYLDDVHTRGTDLQLPLDCQGILTVGIGMQKDKLMQAAMRLRQLAQQQSVSLWGTQKVTLAMARDNQIAVNAITSIEVIKWVTRNTIGQINADLFPVAVRKINFRFLQVAEALLKEAPTHIAILAGYCQDEELFNLDDFYGLSPQVEDLGDRLYLLVAQQFKTFWEALQKELSKKQLENTLFYEKLINSDTKRKLREQLYNICGEVADYLQQGQVQHALDNDQEKEVEVEIIQEQNVMVSIERRDALTENIWDVKWVERSDFIAHAQRKGILLPIKDIANYVQQPALNALHWHHAIYLTANYIQATTAKVNEGVDNYLRPVDVVLIHRLGNQSVCVILSGQEAARIKSGVALNSANLLVHLQDINGPTLLPTGSRVSKEEQKLLTIIKLFAGECHYPEAKEVQRLAKRVGRIYPHYFVNQAAEIDEHGSAKLYGALIEQDYLDFAGIMTPKLFAVFAKLNTQVPVDFDLGASYKPYSEQVLKKLVGLYQKLIMQPTDSLRSNHYTLWQWVGTRGKLKEYPDSALESVLNADRQLKI